jgi:CxxC motif-containing protein (DUF1111 family)
MMEASLRGNEASSRARAASSRSSSAGLAFAFVSLAAACGSSSEPQRPDASPDAAPDARPDASPDGPALELADVEPGEADAAGTATSRTFDGNAYLQPLAGLSGAPRTLYLSGQAMFEIDWVAAPSGNTDRDGLGPTFNALSCRACHPRNGRGAPSGEGEVLATTLLRVSALDGQPHPIYGDQLQTRAVSGVPAEGQARVRYTATVGAYADGAPYELLTPVVELTLALGDAELLRSLRTAPAIIGSGLLEAIPREAIVARADVADADGDGISGRPRLLDGDVLGRFGWKAGNATVDDQNTAAFLGDLGLTSPRHLVENCPAPQAACAGAPSGGAPEIDATRVDATRIFVAATTVPGRRDVAAVPVRRGKLLFTQLACASCHVPRWQTSATPPNGDLPGLASQTIWPYTDLLLHDLGEGLADHRPEGDASGREWRTPPLWGIGLMPVVNGHQRLLHDGRARGLAEAILWHGGEAAPAAARFRALSVSDRAALLAFLGSL